MPALCIHGDLRTIRVEPLGRTSVFKLGELFCADGESNVEVVVSGGEHGDDPSDESVTSHHGDALALVALLKACAKRKNLNQGSKLHANILQKGIFKNNIFIGCTLIHMYAKCGVLTKAQQVFDELSVQNVVSWNALVAGYAQHGHGEEALDCFKRMQDAGLCPTAVTFACALKACGSTAASEKGKEIHSEIFRQGLLGKDPILGNALMDMYAKCGAFSKAQQVFDDLAVRNVVSWNTLIAGYCQQGQGEEALNCFEWMQEEGLSPNAVTFLCIVKACGALGAVDKGKEVHVELFRQGLMGKDDIEISNALVDMYAKCGALRQAQQVFDKLPMQDVVAWTALLLGYCQHGHGEEALACYDRMKKTGLSPDGVTFLCILKVCGSIGALEKGEEIHSEIAKKKLIKDGTVLGNALVDMYTKCGALTKAQAILDKLPVRDVISWTTLIGGYLQHGCREEAFSCFKRMRGEGLSPDSVTYGCILKSCLSLQREDVPQIG